MLAPPSDNYFWHHATNLVTFLLRRRDSRNWPDRWQPVLAALQLQPLGSSNGSVRCSGSSNGRLPVAGGGGLSTFGCRSASTSSLTWSGTQPQRSTESHLEVNQQQAGLADGHACSCYFWGESKVRRAPQVLLTPTYPTEHPTYFLPPHMYL